MIDADALLSGARRPLVLGIGGGGDVVGALGTAEICRLYHAAEPLLGGVAWERRAIDPDPGPRRQDEICDGKPLASCVLAAGPDTRSALSNVRFAESHMARFLKEPTLLVDIHPGPAVIAENLGKVMRQLRADLICLIDVGGDVLAHGTEVGLASPLCDAIMLAAGVHLSQQGIPVLAGIFGPGCDGELTTDECLDRIREVATAGGLAGMRGLTPPVAARLEAAVTEVSTDASAQPLRCFRGERGITMIHNGLRGVVLSPVGALTVYFDADAALRSAARLASAVRDASSLSDANRILGNLGITTELDRERAGRFN
jgi:hypothetical protein